MPAVNISKIKVTVKLNKYLLLLYPLPPSNTHHTPELTPSESKDHLVCG